MSKPDPYSQNYAQFLDATDPLKSYRDQFYLLPNKIYLDGNSLGLMPKPADQNIHRILTEWKTFGVQGWLKGKIPWFYFAEEMGKQISPLVGAHPSEVVMTGTTTLNIHTLINTFYTPNGTRTKILADELNFPTDIYALQGQIRMKGRNSDEDLLLFPSRDGKTLSEKDIIARMDDDIALIFLPSVLYRSGQLLDMELLTRAAHQRGIPIGFDCSHSVGAVPHYFDEWGVDFAIWCSYKYLNGGPGAPAFLYVNKRHFEKSTDLIGWFGYLKKQQFDLNLQFQKAPVAGGWQISAPGIIAAGGVEAALDLTLKAGIDEIRSKSLKMTDYLMKLVDHYLIDPPYNFSINTPRDPSRRSGHVALKHNQEAYRISQALKHHGIISDFRPPDVIRIAPIALYTTYEEIWLCVRILREIIETKEYLQIPQSRTIIS